MREKKSQGMTYEVGGRSMGQTDFVGGRFVKDNMSVELVQSKVKNQTIKFHCSSSNKLKLNLSG